MKPIRSYGFEYKPADSLIFYKQLLWKIAEYDASGDLFYSNNLDYERKGTNKVEVNNTNLFNSAINENWNKGGNDELKGDLISGNAIAEVISPQFTNRPSILGSSENGGASGGFYMGFGFGFTPDIIGTFGPNYNYSYSSGGGFTSFTDINGDGLPDKIFKRDGKLEFRPNLGNGFGGLKPISDIINISRNISHSHSFGFQASFGLFVGATYNKSKNITKTYFSDVNGDGLIDLVDAGTVKFNKTNTQNYLDQSDFSATDNKKTPNPIGAGSISETITNSINVESLNQLRDENPQHDIVKVWIAKKDGTVNITGKAFLEPYPSTVQNPYPLNNLDPTFIEYDGVRLSIQKNGGANSIVQEALLAPSFIGTSSTTTPNSIPEAFTASIPLNVIKGDRIYFRVQAREEGTFDRVKWNPSILYTDTPKIDANGLDYFSSIASEGFIVTGNSGFKVTNQTGATYSIDWPTINLTTLQYSDDLIFEIERQDFDNVNGTYSNSMVYSMNYNQIATSGTQIISSAFGGNNFQTPMTFDSNLQITPVYFFRIKSKSNIDWKLLDWKPIITITPATITLANQISKIYPVINYQIYNKKINSEIISRIEGINPLLPLVVKPIINRRFSPFNTNTTIFPNAVYTLNLVVKNSNKKVIAARTITINKSANISTILPADIANIDISEGITSTIFVEYYTSNINLANLAGDPTEPIKAAIYQADNSLIDPTEFGIPTTDFPAATFFISSVKFHTLNNLGQTAIPHHVGIQSLTNRPNLIKNTIYPFRIQLATTTNQSPAKHAAVWIDYDRDGVIDDNLTPTNEFFTSTTLNSVQTFNILIPNLVSDGNIFIRVRGGSSTAYTSATFNLDDIYGNIRDYLANIVSYTGKYSKDMYCELGTSDKFGLNYRGWGQFAYHGGIIVERHDFDVNNINGIEPNEKQLVKLYPDLTNPNGPKIPKIIARYGDDVNGNIIPIDESELKDYENAQLTACQEQNPNGGVPLADCIKALSIPPSTSIRFFRLTPDNEKINYLGSSDCINVDATHFSASRLGVKNLSTIFVATPTSGTTTATSCVFPQQVGGISLINKGEGYSFSGGGSYGPVGGSANYSTSFNWAETGYMDLNGDRYPDILTKDNAQFTDALGGLNETKSINFGRVSSGDSSNWGASASGTFVTSSTPGTKEMIINIPVGSRTYFAVIPATKTQVHASIGLNGDVGGGSNTEGNLWIDMNGDGLPDRVSLDNGVKVRLNLGYKLEDQYHTWDNGSGELKGVQKNFAGGLGFSWGDNSYSGGVSASASRAYTESNIADINGDGLPDLLLNDDPGNLSYRLNTGNHFEGTLNSNVNGFINFNRSVAEGISGSFTIPIITFFGIKFTPKFNLGAEQSISRVENIIEDINGDGYPDLLFAGNGDNNAVDNRKKTNDGELHAHLSNIGTTNLLKKVTTPTGGSWEVEYTKVDNTFDMPQSKYVLSRIKTFDGFTADNNWSNDRTVTTIEYKNPYHDRRDREFFGFEKVIVNQHESTNNAIEYQADIATLPAIYRHTEQEFFNRNYYLKGAVKKETLFDASNAIWTQNITTYGIFKPSIPLNNSDTTPVLNPTTTPTASAFGLQNYNLSYLVDSKVKYGVGVKTTDTVIDNGFICTDLDHSSLFVTPLVTYKIFTEGQGLSGSNKISLTRMEEFDASGNVKQYRDYGEQGQDVYVSKIKYFPSIASLDNAIAYPEKIQVFDANGTTLQRERRATYNADGNLETVITKLNGADNATVRMEYNDGYGNLTKVIHENSINPNNGQQFFRDYTYDPVLHTYPTRVEDAFGYFSTSEYSYQFGVPVYTTDMNLQPMRTRLDDRGRPIEITGPYELYVEGITGGAEMGWTIRFEYQGESAVASKVANATIDDDNRTAIYAANGSFVPPSTQGNSLHHALTRHFDPEFRASADSVITTNQILTSTLSDGFGKPVQVKKMFAEHLAASTGNIPTAANNKLKWLLPGKVKTDALGRAIESYYPTTQAGNFDDLATNASFVPSSSFVYDNSVDTITPTQTGDYDPLDRPHTTTLPGETGQTTMEYSIDSNRFLTVVTN